MIERGEGGSVILISSGAAYRGGGLLVDYVTAKAGLLGMMRAFAVELAPHWIRVNTIHPSTVLTPIVDNEVFGRVVAGAMHGGEPFASDEDRRQAMWQMIEPRHMLPRGWVETADISNAVLFLASDESRYVTAEEIRVDLGFAGR
jgi:(+)-trans-carveol dehydrogenase